MTTYIKPIAQSAVSIVGEKNDCVVRAAANASGAPYVQVHSVVAKHGRTPKKGCTFNVILNSYSELGFKFVGVCGSTSHAEHAGFVARRAGQKFKHFKGVTLGRFLEIYNTGRYICTIRGHAFAVVDGQLVDAGMLKAGSYITTFFKV